jgi:hypothetical protein
MEERKKHTLEVTPAVKWCLLSNETSCSRTLSLTEVSGETKWLIWSNFSLIFDSLSQFT